MKVVAKTGLVPVHTNNDKTIFGLPPVDVRKGLADGSLFLVDIPDDIETIEVDDGVTALPVAVDDHEPDGLVEIPENWETLHYTKIVVIAKKILGVEDLPEDGDKSIAVIAKEIVMAELAKRAGEQPSVEPTP